MKAYAAQRWDKRLEQQRASRVALRRKVGLPVPEPPMSRPRFTGSDTGVSWYVDGVPAFVSVATNLAVSIKNVGTAMNNLSTSFGQTSFGQYQYNQPSYNITTTPSTWQTITPSYGATWHPDRMVIDIGGDPAALKSAIEEWWTKHHVEPSPEMLVPRRLPSPLPFNRYINASDLLEEFIAFVGAEGVRAGEVFGLPVELFIKWLIIRACEEDQEEPNVELALPAPQAQPRCIVCKRFLRRHTDVPFDRRRCMERYAAKELVA